MKRVESLLYFLFIRMTIFRFHPLYEWNFWNARLDKINFFFRNLLSVRIFVKIHELVILSRISKWGFPLTENRRSNFSIFAKKYYVRTFSRALRSKIGLENREFLSHICLTLSLLHCDTYPDNITCHFRAFKTPTAIHRNVA